MALVWAGGILWTPVAALAMSLQDEIKMGQEAVAEVEKESKVINNPELNQRVNTIGQEIAAVCDETRFKYTFKILDDKDVNAFTLPGGFVYVNKGLLDNVRSDDELAAVLAHEIAHAAHHHMVKMLEGQKKMSRWTDLINLGAIIVLMAGKGGGEGVFQVMSMMEMVKIARTTGLGREAEYDADMAALQYLKKTKYNPAGLLTFMERLAREASLRPELDYGIFQTHPISKDRVARIEEALKDTPINKRMALNIKSSVKVTQVDGKDMGEVYYQDRLIYKTSPARASQIADRINRLLWDDLRLYEVKLDRAKNMVVARGEPLIAPSREDVALNNLPVSTLAEQAFKNLREAMWKESWNNR